MNVEFAAADEEEDIEAILKRADPSFRPVWHAQDKLPRIFRSKNFQVDVITSYGRGRKSPVMVDSLGCAAAALTFQEYVSEETIVEEAKGSSASQGAYRYLPGD